MEMILKIAQEIYSVLSPAEIVFVLALIIGMIPLIVKMLAKVFTNKKVIAALMSDSNNDERDHLLDDIAKKIDKVITKDEHQDHLDKIFLILDEIKSQLNENEQLFNNNHTQIELLKNNIDNISSTLKSEIADIKHQLKMQDLHSQQILDNLKDAMQKMQDSIQKITSQIDKIDEFTRASIPEFRSYHKELTKEIGELSRDIALVERSIQTQINTMNTIKLR